MLCQKYVGKVMPAYSIGPCNRKASWHVTDSFYNTDNKYRIEKYFIMSIMN